MVTIVDKNWVSVKKAAEDNGCTDGYIRRLVREEKVASHMVHERFYLVDNDSVREYFKQPRAPGRPTKGQSENNSEKNR